MAGLDDCLSFTLREEGGFVDNPDDPGGATNMGITLATLRIWRDDKHLGVADIRALSRAVATNIYGTDFWNKLRCDALPNGIDLMAFDFAVTSGTLRSAKILQAALGFSTEATDGAVGPDTLRAVHGANRATVIGDLAERQATYYRALSTFRDFGSGWLARTERRRIVAIERASV